MPDNSGMSIAHYIKEIGRGRKGARSLTREQAADLFGRLLDGSVSDLQVGAFCLAMRIKGETPDEMAGFLDASHARLARLPALPHGRAVVVLPSYNGARKLPLLTPLLALLLARRGVPVLLHGMSTEDGRLELPALAPALGIATARDMADASTLIAQHGVVYADTAILHRGLAQLLQVRRSLSLRNSAHSVVKLIRPCAGPAVVVASYTHPEYATSMADALTLTQADALLMRGTEGESVADPRRMTAMTGFLRGQAQALEETAASPLATTADLPATADQAGTLAYTRAVLAGVCAVPVSMQRQMAHLVRLCETAQARAAAPGTATSGETAAP